MEEKTTDSKLQNPREKASFLSKLFYCWTLPIFIKGYKRDLTDDDIYKPLQTHCSHALGDKLEEAWMNEIKLKRYSLPKALWSIFKAEICFYLLINYFMVAGLKLLQPVLLLRILKYYEPNQTDISRNEANLYVIAMIVVIFLISICGHTYVMGLQQIGIKMRVAICSLLYRKTLRLSKFSMQDTSTGQIITLMSNDVRMFDYVLLEFCLLIIAPSDLILYTIMLYFLLGTTALVGIAFLVMFIPFQMYNGRLSAIYRFKIASKTDQRILLMSEIISGIKVIKMYTWEKPFAKLVEAARRLEVKQIRLAAIINGFLHSYGMYMSRTAQFLCILTYVLTGHIPVAQYVFVITSFYNNLTKTVSVNFPDAFSTISESQVSCRRITKFLLLEENKPNKEKYTDIIDLSGDKNKIGAFEEFKINANKPAGLEINKISSKWNAQDDDVLKDITLKILVPEKIAIIGTVGSGKSSLLNVILGELSVHHGDVKINGSVSYASQEPWLFKGSIRQNILFGLPMVPDKYKEVVRVCSLDKDFDIFPFGDLSVVGERGVMLSGGQKARINLARAIYKDADIYLLDDPLSAVDTVVGKQLFDNCINGYLAKKCVILSTHQLQYLRAMDRIYLLDEGTFQIVGSYKELQNSNSSFLRLLHNNAENETAGKRLIVNDTDDKVVKEAKEEIPKEVKEHIGSGSMGSNVFKEYFKAGGSWYVYVPIALLFIGTQLSASFADYFITFWVNLEQSKVSQENYINKTQLVNPNQAQIFGKSYSEYQPIFPTEKCIYIYTAIVIVLVLMALGRSISFFQFCLSSSTKLHNIMFNKITNAPMRFFNTNPSGRILNRFSKDIGSIDEILPTILLDSIEISITVIAVSIILSLINPWMLIPTVIILSLFYTYQHYYIRTSTSIKRIEGTLRSPVFAHMTASLQGLSTIRAFDAQQVLIKEFDRHQDNHSACYYLFLSCTRAFGILLDMNCIIYVAVVTISTFLSSTFGGNVGLSITQAMGLTGRMQWGVRQWSETENQMTSVERVLEYSQIKTEDDVLRKAPIGWPEFGRIIFKSVALRYGPNEPEILKDLTFEVRPGEKIGIVGRTGAGKSSIISALFRLESTDGTILIDSIDIKKISLACLRSKISIIPQEPFLFSGTLRKNLDPFEEFNDDVLWEALEKVELKTIIDDSPNGLNSMVTESGANFSVGQRQLLCLARALIRKNKILVMDEATANVDPQTDELIQTTIREKFSNCTVLTIAHRLHTIMDSDRVLVMEYGRVAEYDHPHILLTRAYGVFYNLVMETGTGMAEFLRNLAEESYRNSRR